MTSMRRMWSVRWTVRKVVVVAAGLIILWAIVVKTLDSGMDGKMVSTLRGQFMRTSLLIWPIVNAHNFTYIHTPSKKCRSGHPETLIVVPSAPGNFDRRHKFRQEINNRMSQMRETRVLFFIGVPSAGPNKLAIQAKIEEEVKNYDDIVQENFTDVYRNMRLKAVSMLRWASTRCAQVRFVIRLDDDILGMDPNEMVVVLKEKEKVVSDFIMAGRVRLQDVPDRNVTHVKWYLSEEEYPIPFYPPYALGGSLGYPLSTVRLLYEATLRVPPLWLDDVYITGICATQLNIPLFQDQAFSFTHKDTPASDLEIGAKDNAVLENVSDHPSSMRHCLLLLLFSLVSQIIAFC